jgi:hypothetical protein
MRRLRNSFAVGKAYPCTAYNCQLFHAAYIPHLSSLHLSTFIHYRNRVASSVLYKGNLARRHNLVPYAWFGFIGSSPVFWWVLDFTLVRTDTSDCKRHASELYKRYIHILKLRTNCLIRIIFYNKSFAERYFYLKEIYKYFYLIIIFSFSLRHNHF